MSAKFAVSEIVQIGVQIEENGRDFYLAVEKSCQNKDVKDIFRYLADEEAKHIKDFSKILEVVQNYEPKESFPDEYFAYLKALSKDHVFIKGDGGKELVKEINDDIQALTIAIGFEKDSILFYSEMKKVIEKGTQGALDKLIENEQEHFKKLSEIRNIMMK